MVFSYRAIALALVLACGQVSRTSPDSTGDPTRMTDSMVPTVSVSADSTSVAAGSRVTFTVTVTNAGNAALTLNFPSGCQTDFELLDESGAVIGQSGKMCTQALTQRVLAPGASFTESHIWVRGLRGMPQPGPGAASVAVRGLLLATGVTAAPSNTVKIALK